ncbi:hypothetical protein Y032_0100g3264 [Ancylostoma ceylanicum]|uniref:Uncharacterized protein n=1 Tax=Ancylostoma ceylanicum TaxID=53326 RepID=A0A016TIG7_9BILA|nr:hypothetical protein Y032_0100g3264 [Ancylostoma ceylanicum]
MSGTKTSFYPTQNRCEKLFLLLFCGETWGGETPGDWSNATQAKRAGKEAWEFGISQMTVWHDFDRTVEHENQLGSITKVNEQFGGSLKPPLIHPMHLYVTAKLKAGCSLKTAKSTSEIAPTSISVLNAAGVFSRDG